MRIKRFANELTRTLVAIAALAAMTRGLAAPPCEHHGGMRAVSAMEASPGTDAHQHHPAAPSDGERNEHEGCQCIGDCSAGVPPLAPPPTVARIGIVAPVAVAAPQHAARRVHERTRFALPLSTAPPVRHALI